MPKMFAFVFRVPGVVRVSAQIEDETPSVTGLEAVEPIETQGEPCAPGIVQVRPRRRSGAFPLSLVEGGKRRAS